MEMCTLLWRIKTWCHHYRILLRARHIPGCLNVMTDSLTRLTKIHLTECLTASSGFKLICHMWFTPHIVLFATCLNHKAPLYVSPVPDQQAWKIIALNMNWLGLITYPYLPIALLHRVIQKIHQCKCLVILIAPGWPGMPCFWDQVQLPMEIPLWLPV